MIVTSPVKYLTVSIINTVNNDISSWNNCTSTTVSLQTLFKMHSKQSTQQQQQQQDENSEECCSLPMLRLRTSSDFSWADDDDDQDSGENRVDDLLPAIRKCILNSESTLYDQDGCDSSVSSSSSSSITFYQRTVQYPNNSDRYRFLNNKTKCSEDSDHDNCSDELSIFLLDDNKNVDATTGTATVVPGVADVSMSSYGSRSSSQVSFSSEPPTIHCYDSPGHHYHKELYYGPIEMQNMLIEFLEEQKHE